jgi:hypothetical protein
VERPRSTGQARDYFGVSGGGWVDGVVDDEVDGEVVVEPPLPVGLLVQLDEAAAPEPEALGVDSDVD